MRERSREIITELIRTIKTYYSLSPNIEKVIKVIKDEEQENKEAYGYNYWKSVLRLSLIEYDFFGILILKANRKSFFYQKTFIFRSCFINILDIGIGFKNDLSIYFAKLSISRPNILLLVSSIASEIVKSL